MARSQSFGYILASCPDNMLDEAKALVGAPKQTTRIFKPGKMGITYDDQGIVEKVSFDGQAHANGITSGDQIWKVGTEKFSNDAVMRAEKSGVQYEVVFKVRRGLCATIGPELRADVLGTIKRDVMKTTRVALCSTILEKCLSRCRSRPLHDPWFSQWKTLVYVSYERHAAHDTVYAFAVKGGIQCEVCDRQRAWLATLSENSAFKNIQPVYAKDVKELQQIIGRLMPDKKLIIMNAITGDVLLEKIDDAIPRLVRDVRNMVHKELREQAGSGCDDAHSVDLFRRGDAQRLENNIVLDDLFGHSSSSLDITYRFNSVLHVKDATTSSVVLTLVNDDIPETIADLKTRLAAKMRENRNFNEADLFDVIFLHTNCKLANGLFLFEKDNITELHERTTDKFIEISFQKPAEMQIVLKLVQSPNWSDRYEVMGRLEELARTSEVSELVEQVLSALALDAVFQVRHRVAEACERIRGPLALRVLLDMVSDSNLNVKMRVAKALAENNGKGALSALRGMYETARSSFNSGDVRRRVTDAIARNGGNHEISTLHKAYMEACTSSERDAILLCNAIASHVGKKDWKLIPHQVDRCRYVMSVKYDFPKQRNKKNKGRVEPPYAQACYEYLSGGLAYNPNNFKKGDCGKKTCRGVYATTCCYGGLLFYPSWRLDGACRRPLIVCGKPHNWSCWRASFRWHLHKEKNMLQIVEGGTLGPGQEIEIEMAKELGVNVYRIDVCGYAAGVETAYWHESNFGDKDAIAKGEIILGLLDHKIVEEF